MAHTAVVRWHWPPPCLCRLQNLAQAAPAFRVGRGHEVTSPARPPGGHDGLCLAGPEDLPASIQRLRPGLHRAQDEPGRHARQSQPWW